MKRTFRTTTLTLLQRGNTLTGLIIGLVVGLGIAIAVALLITKTSTPFTNKGGKPAELPATQLADPNRPLYSNKEPVKEAAKEVAASAAIDKVAPPHPDTRATPASGAVVASSGVVVNRPAPAATTPAVVIEKSPEVPDEKYIYYLQVGAFHGQAEAESARARLLMSGFETKVSENNSDSGTIYRVRLGPFSQAEAMNRTKLKLSDNGVDVAVVRLPKN